MQEKNMGHICPMGRSRVKDCFPNYLKYVLPWAYAGFAKGINCSHLLAREYSLRWGTVHVLPGIG